MITSKSRSGLFCYTDQSQDSLRNSEERTREDGRTSKKSEAGAGMKENERGGGEVEEGYKGEQGEEQQQ